MGYTHYYTFQTIKRGDAQLNEQNYQRAIADCNKVIRYVKRNICNLAGYSAHGAPYGGINLNGVKDSGHESFTCREHLNQNRIFNFCKTARKPYDIAVTACLAILAYRLGGVIVVSSDGDANEWIDGVEVARKVLRRKVPNPIAKQMFEAKTSTK